jgi:hypothetical protein
VGLPVRIFGKAPRSGGEQSGDDAFRYAVFDQVGQRRSIDHVVGMAGAQQVQEVQPALRRAGGEPSEVVVADVRGVFIAPGVPGAGVIDRHPGGGCQPGLQDGVLLAVESILVGRQEGDDLTLGNAHAQAFQLGEQALHRHLPLDVLHQDIAHDPGAEVAAHLGRQRGDDLLAVRCYPALAAEADDLRRQEEILHGEGLEAATP